MQNLPMKELRALSDAKLLARAHRWRLHAARGVALASQRARAHEDEVQRRFAGKTVPGPLEIPPRPPRKRSLWQRLCRAL